MSQPSPDAVRQQLAEQVAFYMSDTNLITDDYMLRHLACHDWVLPLLVIAPFKLVDRFLLQLGAWSSLHDRLAELQRGYYPQDKSLLPDNGQFCAWAARRGGFLGPFLDGPPPSAYPVGEWV